MTKISDHRKTNLIKRFATLVDARNPLRRYADDWAEGFPTTTTGGSGRSGEHPDPVGRTVVGPSPDLDVDRLHPDYGKTQNVEGKGFSERAANLADAIDNWIHDGELLARRVANLMPKDHPVAEMLAKHRELRQVAAGPCKACGRDVTGVREDPAMGVKGDRLISGYCFGQAPHCYRAWCDAGRPDRAKFERTRSQTLATDEPAGTSLARVNGVPSAGSGRELSPASPYCEHIPPHLTDPDSFRCSICNPAHAVGQ